MAIWVSLSCARGVQLCGGREPEIWHRKIVCENVSSTFTCRFTCTYTYTYAPFTFPAKSLRAAYLLVPADCKIIRIALRLTNTSSHIRCFRNMSWSSVPLMITSLTYLLTFTSYNKTQLDALISQIYFWNKTLHVSDSSSVHHQEFFTVHTAMIYIVQVCWQPFLPDDGQRNCPKHVEFYSKNIFEKLVHLVGFYCKNLSRCTVTWMSNYLLLLTYLLTYLLTPRSRVLLEKLTVSQLVTLSPVWRPVAGYWVQGQLS